MVVESWLVVVAEVHSETRALAISLYNLSFDISFKFDLTLSSKKFVKQIVCLKL